MSKTTDQQNCLEESARLLREGLIRLRKSTNEAEAKFLAVLGNLSMQELSVLNAIGDTTSATMSDLAKQTSFSLSSITLIVNKLIKKKMVIRTRSESDRRVVYAELSEEGKVIYQAQLEHVLSSCKYLLSNLSESEQQLFSALFQKMTVGDERNA